MSSTSLNINIGYIVLVASPCTLNYTIFKVVNILDINLYRGFRIGLYPIYPG